MLDGDTHQANTQCAHMLSEREHFIPEWPAIRRRELVTANSVKERKGKLMRVFKGNSYFGSGGYSAGWKVLEGEVSAVPIPNTVRDNGFYQGQEWEVTPITAKAVIEVWCGDSISSSGWRNLGTNGTFTLVKE